VGPFHCSTVLAKQQEKIALQEAAIAALETELNAVNATAAKKGSKTPARSDTENATLRNKVNKHMLYRTPSDFLWLFP
jgi:hypothetical protein